MTDISDTRTRILEAAMSVIEDTGEGALRVQKIAESVGVREPSVYHFFKNREELVEAAHIERYRRSHLEMVRPFQAGAALADNAEDFRRIVKKILSLIYSAEREDIRSTRMSVLGAAQTSPKIAEAIRQINFEVFSKVAEVFATAQEKNWIRKEVDPLAAAYWINGQILGRVMAEMDKERVDLDKWNQISETAVSYFLFG
ncbi:MAG: TetR/AcrR family transcriptional regulator [Actinomycetes bacterium]